MVSQSFEIDWNELSAAISLLGMVKTSHHGTLCNNQQLTQPPLALAVPLSRFTPRVGGGSAFFVGGIARYAQDHQDYCDCSDAIPYWRCVPLQLHASQKKSAVLCADAGAPSIDFEERVFRRLADTGLPSRWPETPVF